jgi:cytochrome c
MKLNIVMMIGTLLLLTGVAASGAGDGTALYKSKCAGCHGASGEGKPAAKSLALKGTSLSEDQITERLVKGMPTGKSPHKKGIAGLTEAQAKAIAAYVKTL